MLPRILLGCPDTCETCRFWQPDDEFDDNILGECSRKAPRLHRVASPEAADAHPMTVLIRRPWPLTESRDWCAEWKPGYAA